MREPLLKPSINCPVRLLSTTSYPHRQQKHIRDNPQKPFNYRYLRKAVLHTVLLRYTTATYHTKDTGNVGIGTGDRRNILRVQTVSKPCGKLDRKNERGRREPLGIREGPPECPVQPAGIQLTTNTKFRVSRQPDLTIRGPQWRRGQLFPT